MAERPASDPAWAFLAVGCAAGVPAVGTGIEPRGEAAPELVEPGADAIAVVRIDATQSHEAVDGARACPMGAITVLEADGDCPPG